MDIALYSPDITPVGGLSHFDECTITIYLAETFFLGLESPTCKVHISGFICMVV
ncbi:hypothetical protein M378DRAFT_168177 [Amanita muscaria Koide BX008]|uniref:Uncharacterized protein n=1 Tax=Amanita muscaria (strain Koide BX008) TaxID=946122 RepID=A0A0C2WG60_AMAMK|nr:hypothetical protein M378DRAFT_168177 [Amanita muscaria Koide BX008]